MKKSENYYVYTHSLAGKPPFYVGKANENRVKRIYRLHNRHHTRIIEKYGKENIIVKTMLCRDEQHALDLEVKMIAALRNSGVKLVNMTDGGEGASGVVISESTREKMRYAQKNRPSPSIDTKRKTSESMKKISHAISAKLKGRPVSEKTREKMSITQKRICGTEERKELCSKIHKGKVLSEETRYKISKAMKGRKLSDNTKNNMSIAKKGKPLSDEHKLKMKKPKSQEARQNMAIAQKMRKPISEETRLKMIASRMAYIEKIKNTSGAQ